MENCNNKQELITLYKNEYPPEHYRSFLELTLTKLGNLSDGNSIKLTDSQRNGIQDILNQNVLLNQMFYDGLELLSFKQIDYVGW